MSDELRIELATALAEIERLKRCLSGRARFMENEQLRALLLQAYPVMATHAARHLQKAERATKPYWAENHRELANTSSAWLARAATHIDPAALEKLLKPAE